MRLGPKLFAAIDSSANSTAQSTLHRRKPVCQPIRLSHLAPAFPPNSPNETCISHWECTFCAPVLPGLEPSEKSHCHRNAPTSLHCTAKIKDVDHVGSTLNLCVGRRRRHELSMKLGVAVGDDLERKNNAGMRTARFRIRLVLDASFDVMWSLSPVHRKHGCLARKNRTQPYYR